MRKLLIAAMAVAVAVAVASVAMAANTYTVHQAGTSKKGKGSKANPIPTGLKLGFKVAETDPSKRATVIEKYSLGAEGLVTNTKAAPKCAFTELDDGSGVPAKCNKALVGRGLVKNAAGPSGDQSLANSSPCNLELRLYNTGKGMAIRLDSNGKPAPGGFGDFSSNEVGCLLPIATAIDAKFVKTKIGGVVASDLRFTVPQNLKHPLTGTDNSIRETANTVFLKSKVIRGERVGYYNKVGCKGNKRTTRATFTTEATSSAPARTFTAVKQTKC
jgi:hypothetical protein